MAVASGKGSVNRAGTRGRSSSNGSRSSGKARTTAQTKATRQSSRSSAQSSSGNAQQTGARARSQGASSRRSSAPRSSGASQRDRAGTKSNGAGASRETNSRQPTEGKRGALANIGISVVSVAAGVAGGVLLGRTALQRNRNVLGIPVPTKIDLGDMTQQIGEAGRQFGKLASEVRAVREKAEQVGRIIS